MAGSILIQNAAVVGAGDAVGDLPSADIQVSGGVITAVGPDLALPPGTEVIDASAMVAMPGFVDGHRHMWEGLIRNALPDADLTDYLRIVNGQFAPAYTPEDAFLGELITALGALDAGVTTVFDWSHVQTTPDHTSAVIEALRRSGIRAVFAFGPPGSPDRGHRWPHDIARLHAAEFSHPGDLLTLALATFSPEHQPYEQARQHFRLAREADALITVHAGLSGMGEPDQIERFGREGLLGPDVNLVHCNTLSDTEWKIVADTGASVSITPSTEMQMGQGIPPLRQAMSAGVTTGIGVDVEVSVATDMWSQMRILFALHRSQMFEAHFAGKPAAAPVTTAQLLHFATAGGAAACRLGSQVGSLAAGKQADIVLLRADTIHTRPVNDLTSVVVHNMDARNVDTVLVAGRVVKRDGALVGVDLPKLYDQVYNARDRLFARADVPLAAGGHR